MALIVGDRVLETSTTAGTGTLTLAGAGSGYQSFTVGVGVGNQTYYTIYDPTALTWEVGIGTLLTGTTLSRTTVYANSAGTTALINFAANSKNVFCTSPASKYVDQSDIGTAPNQVPLNQYLGKLAFMDVVDTISNNPYYDTAISDVQPTLNLDFVNSKTLDSRITFARATTATYYDAKSSAVAEQNLILQSQIIGGTSWTNVATTASVNNTTAPDGTTTASSIVATTANTSHRCIPSAAISGIIIGSPYTVSVYAKANGYTKLFIGDNYGDKIAVTFDLTAGTVISNTRGVGTITSVGNGWYRCSVTWTQTTYTIFNPLFIGYPDSGTTGFNSDGVSYAGDGTSGLFIWGAQLEQRSSATAYNATTTTALTNYIPTLQTAPINVARLDYNPTTRVPNGLLIEEQRTNLALYSEQFDNAAWNAASGALVVTANTAIAPDGILTADSIALANSFKCQFVLVSNSTAYSFSVWLKTDTGTKNVQLREINGYGQTTVTVTTSWQRFTLNYTSGGTSNLIGIDQRSGTSPSQSGTLFIWGAQLEAGAFATSYIPTVASQVTRSADAASMTGTNFSSWYNQSQGTLYTGFLTNNPYGASANYIACISDGTIANMINMANYVGLSGTIRINSTNIYSPTLGTSVVGIPSKSSISFTNTAATLAWNGAFTSGTYSGTANMTVLNIGTRADSNSITFLNGWIRKLQYYPQALSNAELQELTA